MNVRVRPDPGLNQLVRTAQVGWKPLEEPDVTGVWIKSLRYDAASRRAPTIMLRFDAGASYPAHIHPGGEEIFVLEGDIRLGKDRLSAGDYLYTAPNNVHAVHSEGGCIVLVNVPQAVEVLQARNSNVNARKRSAY